MDYFERRIRIARQNPYHSVKRVVLEQPVSKQYIGLKDVVQIPSSLLRRFEETKNYVVHTFDAHSLGGRAIDLNIHNPITGKWMSGSSSGTAVNVFCELNDLGIGTDGGGSVLAPGMALNLYAFISILIEEDYLKDYVKKSTDGISFTPSIGFMCRSFSEIYNAATVVLPLNKVKESIRIGIDLKDSDEYPFPVEKLSYPDIYGDRQELISFLQDALKIYDILISKEGPIDYFGMGDSIFGSYGGFSKEAQRASKKGLLRVVNMAGASAISIPAKELSTGYLLICKSDLKSINNMFGYAEMLVGESSSTARRYFHNLAMYEDL